MIWLIKAWQWLASSRIAQAAIAIGGLISYHLFAKWRAARTAVKEEREQARVEAYERRAEAEGDIASARDELKEQQEERREREKDDDPRARFGRDPWG